MSYNNRPAIDVIPFLSPLIAPGARVLGPVLNAIAATPIRGTVEVRLASSALPLFAMLLAPKRSVLLPHPCVCAPGRGGKGGGANWRLVVLHACACERSWSCCRRRRCF